MSVIASLYLAVKVGRVSIGTILSAGIVDVFSGEVANAADLGGDAAPAAWAQPDPPERAIGRRWLAVAAAALVTGAYAAQVVVPAAETSPAPIAGIAPNYGPKTVSAVPNAMAIVRRIWLPGLDAGYDPQGLAVDGGGIYVSAYRSDSLGVRRGPCRVIRIDLETGAPFRTISLPGPAIFRRRANPAVIAPREPRREVGSLTRRRRDPLPTIVSVNGDDGPCPMPAIRDTRRDRLSWVARGPSPRCQ